MADEFSLKTVPGKRAKADHGGGRGVRKSSASRPAQILCAAQGLSESQILDAGFGWARRRPQT
jgi:hypothetical protein